MENLKQIKIQEEERKGFDRKILNKGENQSKNDSKKTNIKKLQWVINNQRVCMNDSSFKNKLQI